MRLCGLLLLSLFQAQPAAAHEVRHTVAAGHAAVVQLAYADGSPFAYEKFELYAAGRDQPWQVGNTDHAGRVVFVPDGQRAWRLRAFAADGHGADLRFEVDAGTATAAGAATDATAGGMPREARLLTGLALILGGFGAYHLYLRRKKEK